MSSPFSNLRKFIRRERQVSQQNGVEHPRSIEKPPIEIAPNDPLIAYFQQSHGVVDIERLNLDSPALKEMREANIKLAVPLVSQGELVGVLNLGPRLSEQDYSLDDRAFLENLATQATPAVRVAQLVRQQQTEFQARERVEQELRVARLIQQTLLPKQLPEIPGWKVAVLYQPARAVGGDFYDFFQVPDGRLVITIGDVTDKGVPAALVMATTRSILRGAARRLVSPSAALVRTNELLHPEIPPNMFVTCLYAILDPATGRMQYANAGHDLPYLRHDGRAGELRATGMPLGLMPGMQYEEKEIILQPGDSLLLYSDGLVEAHNPQHEMFGFPRLGKKIESYLGSGESMIDFLLADLASFTGSDWEQEDDISMVTVDRSAQSLPQAAKEESSEQILSCFSMPSIAGSEEVAINQVEKSVRRINLPDSRLERLKTAIGEATMNAIEHGSKNQPDMPVSLKVLVREKALIVRITDYGGGRPIPNSETPDLEAKLEGMQSPRGWGLFLIERMVDEMHVETDQSHHTVELLLNL
jgi:serine phosphatase RsbU (regulator of sigma subunit)/anti-sigma regulatory factor (Ser/Thr protein kinase)